MTIGKAGGLRQTIAAATGEHPPHGIVVIAQVSGTDEHGSDTIASTKYGADAFTAIQKGHLIAAVWTDGLVAPHQPRLGTTKRRHVENHTQMGGKPQAAGVSNSLTIAHHGVEGSRQAAERAEHRWNFAKGEETGDVRKVDPATRAASLQHASSDDIPDNGHSKDVVLCKSAIQPDDSPWHRARNDPDPVPQTILHDHRRARLEVPAVGGPRN